jgi:alpha/beta superfamily hydrolase
MDIPKWLKPALWGAAAGAVALAFIGFSWGGWVSGSTAEKMASDRARLEVVAALVPICLQQSKQDPKFVATLAEIEAARSFEGRDLVMNAGWATMPGTAKPNREVASACLKELATQS